MRNTLGVRLKQSKKRTGHVNVAISNTYFATSDQPSNALLELTCGEDRPYSPHMIRILCLNMRRIGGARSIVRRLARWWNAPVCSVLVKFDYQSCGLWKTPLESVIGFGN